MAELTAILKSLQNEAYVQSNRQEHAETDTLFDEVDAEAAAEPELRLPPMYPEPKMEIVDISDNNE